MAKKKAPTKKVVKKFFDKETIKIKGLEQIKADVIANNEERKFNPSVILDEDTGVVHIDKKPHMIVDNEYVPYDEAKLLFQKRKVVREYLILEDMEKKLKN